MIFYSQYDPRWKDYKYFGNYTIGGYGCFIVSLSMLDGRDPITVANLLKNGGCFDSQGMLDSVKAAQVLGLEYNGKSSSPDGVCIAETDAYTSKGYHQHFVVWLNNGLINDPLLDHGETVNNYHIVSYRLFKTKEVPMVCKIDDQKALDMRRHLVFRTFNMVLGRPGDPTEQEIADNADWIDRDSGDKFNYPGMADYVVDLYNSDEAKAYRQKQIDDAVSAAVAKATKGLIKPEDCPKDVASPKPDVTEPFPDWNLIARIKSWFKKK